MRNLIQIQQEYMDTVSGGMDRWAHRRDGGHSHRIRGGAWRKAMKALLAWGYTEQQARQIIRDAHDVMTLERDAKEEAA